MPLTCIQTTKTGGLARLDVTELRGEEWSALHRVRPRPLLSCPECGGRLHAKQSHKGFRFFAHDHANRGCSLTRETEEHQHLKRLVADLVRSEVGWESIIEAGPDDGDQGGWRADVLARGPKGRRIAFEVQLAPMTAAVGRERAAVYDADKVESIWITPANPQWVMRIPSLAIRAPDQLTEVDAGQIRVVRGIYQLGGTRRLEPRGGNPPLSRIVTGLLTGEYRTQVLVQPDELKVVIAPSADIDVALREATNAAPVTPLPELPRVQRPTRASYPTQKDEASVLYGFDDWAGDVYRNLYNARQRFEEASDLESSTRATAMAQQGRGLLDAAARQVEDLRAELDEYVRKIEDEPEALRSGMNHRRCANYGREKLTWAQTELSRLRAARRHRISASEGNAAPSQSQTATNKSGDVAFDNAIFRARKCLTDSAKAKGAERAQLEAVAHSHLGVAANQVARMARDVDFAARMLEEKSEQASRAASTLYERTIRQEAATEVPYYEHRHKAARDQLSRAQAQLDDFRAVYGATFD